MKIKIIAIMMTLVLLMVSFSTLVGAEEICGIQSETVDDSEVVEVTKKIRTDEGLVDEIDAKLADFLTFNITITYHDSDGEEGAAYKIKDIVVVDRLPLELLFKNNSPPEGAISEDYRNLTWNLDGVELYDGDSFSFEFDVVVIGIGNITNTVEVYALEKCISVDRYVTSSATIHAEWGYPYKTRDVDDDGNLEYAFDFDLDSSNGYEMFIDFDFYSFGFLSSGDVISMPYERVDGDGDGKYDHLIDIGIDIENYNYTHREADRYWDPDDDVLSIVHDIDVDYDGTIEYVFDSDGYDGLDKYYDPDDWMVHDYIVYELTVVVDGNGTVDVYPDGTIFLKNFEVDLTAIADENATFDTWSGDLTSEEASVTIVMNSDKTITAHFIDDENDTDENVSVNILKPKKHRVYKDNIPIRFKILGFTKIIGPITIKVSAKSDNGIDRVEFYINDELKHTEHNRRIIFEKRVYRWTWLFKPIELNKVYTIKVVAYDNEGNNNTDEITVKRVRYHPLLHHPILAGAGFTATATGAGVAGIATAGGLFFIIRSILNRRGKGDSSEDGSGDAKSNEPNADAGGPYRGIVGEPVQFDGSGSSDPNEGDTLTYLWDFGDGETSTKRNPTHKYTKADKYILKLKVTDESGNTNQAETTVYIDPASEDKDLDEEEPEEDDLFWYIVLGLSLLLLAIIGLLYVGGKFK